MKIKLCCKLWLILYLFFILSSQNVFAESIIDKTNSPHGEEGMCHYCHDSKVVNKASIGFRLNPVEKICIDCHEERGLNIREYLKDMLPNVANKNKMIDYLAKHPDFTCHSCHNVMCQTNSRKELKYRNPHIQLDQSGKNIKKTCLYCHTTYPTSEQDKNDFDKKVSSMRYDLKYLCNICHVMSSNKRGLGFGKQMPTEMISKKEQFEKKHDVTLPLGPENTVICASCHNPHQAGVRVGKSKKIKLPDNHRLALKDSWKMCSACHAGKY